MENHFIFIATIDVCQRFVVKCLNVNTGNFKLSCIQCGTFDSIQNSLEISNINWQQ